MEEKLISADSFNDIQNADGEASVCKKRKLSHPNDKCSKSIHETLHSFEMFHTRRILSEISRSKMLFVEGCFAGDDRPAVVMLEKTPFPKVGCEKLLSRTTSLKQNFHNDIYSMYMGFPSAEYNDIKVTVIHPATEKHVQKYLNQSLHLIHETFEMYKKITLPFLESQHFSLQWVYNILEHKSEAERIIFEDSDPVIGFVLLPDMKWNQSNLNDLYLLAICHQKGIKSLRDLTSDHLPLLKNIRKKGTEAIKNVYNVPEDKLRIYLHYQPSYYHLHIHFTALAFEAPGSSVESAHLLDTVIHNLELLPDYYKKVTLNFVLKQNNPLYIKLCTDV